MAHLSKDKQPAVWLTFGSCFEISNMKKGVKATGLNTKTFRVLAQKWSCKHNIYTPYIILYIHMTIDLTI